MGKSLSSHGDTTVSGGALVLNASGNPLDVKGKLYVTGGSILGAGGSQSVKVSPEEGSIGFIGVEVHGAAGDRISVASDAGTVAEMDAVCMYNIFICFDESVVSGESYTVTAGESSVKAGASK